MLLGFLKAYVGENAAPFAAIALFVLVVSISLWLTPKLAAWIDSRRSDTKSFYDGMMEQPPENEEEK